MLRKEEDLEEQGSEEEDDDVGEGGRRLQQRHRVDDKFDVDPVDFLGNDDLDELLELNFDDGGEAAPGRNDVPANNKDGQQGGGLLGAQQVPEVAANH